MQFQQSKAALNPPAQESLKGVHGEGLGFRVQGLGFRV